MSVRISKGVTRGRTIMVRVDGRAIEAFEGETVATVMLAAGITGFRSDAAGRPRGLFCNMGTCSECFVTVRTERDGPPRRLRACLTAAAMGMDVETGEAPNG